MDLLLDGEGLAEGFAASRPGAAQGARPEHESGLRCGSAIAYSAAFCTWKLFPASERTASVLKTVGLGLN